MPGAAGFALKSLKAQKLLKYLDIMYQNANYIWIFRYSKMFWFSMKKCSCHQYSSGVPRDSYIFWVDVRYNCKHFPLCVTGFREGGLFATHSWAAPKRLILDKVKYPAQQTNTHSKLAGKTDCQSFRVSSILKSAFKTFKILFKSYIGGMDRMHRVKMKKPMTISWLSIWICFKVLVNQTNFHIKEINRLFRFFTSKFC